MHYILRSLKQELKSLGLGIRTNRKEIRKLQSEAGGGCGDWKLFNQISRDRYEFRHKHIVYGLLRGRTRDQIEKPKPDNLPKEKYIAELKATYEAKMLKGCTTCGHEPQEAPAAPVAVEPAASPTAAEIHKGLMGFISKVPLAFTVATRKAIREK